jgi:DNA-binding PadR family transcriptional regulator
MSLRHAVLGLLASRPSTGYDLAQRFQGSLASAWHASHSQIYPELARLQEEGMIEVVGEGPRRSRTWAITGEGREELRRWMTEIEPSRIQRNETGVRWFLLGFLDSTDRRVVLERELAFVAEDTARLQTIAERLDTAPEPGPFRPTVDLGLRISEVMHAWLQDQLDALD